MGFVYVASSAEWTYVLRKGVLERAAIWLMVMAFVVWLNAALRARTALHVIMTALAFVFLCREIHFAGTSTGVYVGVVAVGVWAFAWRERLREPLDRGQVWPWLTATAWTYVLSQLVARRVFRFLPMEDPLHVPLEETVETVAHTMLVVTAFADLMPRKKGASAVPRTDRPEETPEPSRSDAS